MSKATRDIEITRIFDARREHVWRAWTNPEHFKCWWGPKNSTTPFCTIDFRVGGKNINCMHLSEGEDFWNAGTFREIVPLKRIVYTDSFADKDGNIVPASTYGITAEWPDEALVTLTFDGQGDKTRFTLKHEGVPTGKDGDLCKDGWNESFDRLAECLK